MTNKNFKVNFNKSQSYTLQEAFAELKSPNFIQEFYDDNGEKYYKTKVGPNGEKYNAFENERLEYDDFMYLTQPDSVNPSFKRESKVPENSRTAGEVGVIVTEYFRDLDVSGNVMSSDPFRTPTGFHLSEFNPDCQTLNWGSLSGRYFYITRNGGFNGMHDEDVS